MTAPLHEPPFFRRILPRRPGEGYSCFWGCGRPVPAVFTVCYVCKGLYKKAAEGMPEAPTENPSASPDVNLREGAFLLGCGVDHLRKRCVAGKVKGAYQKSRFHEWRIPRKVLEKLKAEGGL